MRKEDVTRRPGELGPLTDAEAEELRALAEMPDDQIDTSDIPALTDAQLARMVRGRFYRPVKQQITARSAEHARRGLHRCTVLGTCFSETAPVGATITP